MTRTIKKLMCLSSDEQVQKLLRWERALNDAIFAKETVFELLWRSFMYFYFEFEFMKHRTIKRDAKNGLEMQKCLTKMLITLERHFAQTWALNPTFSVGVRSSSKVVGSSDPHWNFLVSSDKGFSASWFIFVGSSDKYKTALQRLVLGARV